MTVDQAQALRVMVRQRVDPDPAGGPTSPNGSVADMARPRPESPAEPAYRFARALAITSGKGGVGKSTLAVNLAICLTRMGRRVVLVDADLGTANADVLCNLNPSATLAQVVAGRASLEQVALAAPGGFRLIPGASGLAQVAALSPQERQRLIAQFHHLEREADILLIDTGAGVGPNVLGFLAAVDDWLVVTSPDPTAITDAYALIKSGLRQVARHGQRRPQVRLLVNMVRDQSEARSVYTRIAGVTKRFLDLPLRYAGYVPFDAEIQKSIRERRPFALNGGAPLVNARLRQLAHRLDRHAVDPPARGMLRRMAHWCGLASN